MIPAVRNAMPVRHTINHIINLIALRNNEGIKIIAEDLVVVVCLDQIFQFFFSDRHPLPVTILHGSIVCLYVD